MKLNHDYVRDILLYIENNIGYKDSSNPNSHKMIRFGKFFENDIFENYNKEELKYALELLIKEKFVECSKEPHFVDGNLMSANIIGLTWNGHALLDNIRNDTIWNAVKEKSKKIGKVSITTLASTAGTLANAMMTNPNALDNFMQGIANIKGIL